MNCDTSQEIKTPLYIYDGAEFPSGYLGATDLLAEDQPCDALVTKPGFWERQLSKAADKKTNKWDWIFGVIMPGFCFVADPFVFKSGFGSNDGFLSDYRPFAYLLSFASIMAMIAWLLWGERLKGFGVLVSGVLAAGAAISLVIGLILFPFSFLGLIVLIGIFGFTPLFTSVVFWRNSLRAYLAAKPYFESGLLTRTVGLVMLSALVIPIIVNAALEKNIVARVARDRDQIAAQNYGHIDTNN